MKSHFHHWGHRDKGWLPNSGPSFFTSLAGQPGLERACVQAAFVDWHCPVLEDAVLCEDQCAWVIRVWFQYLILEICRLYADEEPDVRNCWVLHSDPDHIFEVYFTYWRVHASAVVCERCRPCMGETVWRLHWLCFELHRAGYSQFEWDGRRDH